MWRARRSLHHARLFDELTCRRQRISLPQWYGSRPRCGHVVQTAELLFRLGVCSRGVATAVVPVIVWDPDAAAEDVRDDAAA